MSPDDANEFTEALGQIVAGSWRQIALAQRLGVPQALGVSTADWVEQRLGGYVRLSLEERRTAVAELTAPKQHGGNGLNTREAAEVLGVGHATVARDRQVVSHETHGTNGWIQDPLPPVSIETGRMLQLPTHTGELVEYREPKGPPTFNQTQGDNISWARWSWNPVTGCLHGCDYCYAREIATGARSRAGFPAGFAPLFHPERLEAPRHTVIPAQYRDDPSYRRVFVCSMADLYGRWVPRDWIDAVHGSMLASPEWEYLLLTKFPDRYVGLEFPPTAWVGTSIDTQKRVKIAERAFRKIDGVKVKWLSLEPLLEPLEFTDLSMFDWVVIGAQTATHQPTGTVEAFSPPIEWVARLIVQAQAAGCKIHCKPNLEHGPGVRWLDEYPTRESDT